MEAVTGGYEICRPKKAVCKRLVASWRLDGAELQLTYSHFFI
jgi:hypothetical protein